MLSRSKTSERERDAEHEWIETNQNTCNFAVDLGRSIQMQFAFVPTQIWHRFYRFLIHNSSIAQISVLLLCVCFLPTMAAVVFVGANHWDIIVFVRLIAINFRRIRAFLCANERPVLSSLLRHFLCQSHSRLCFDDPALHPLSYYLKANKCLLHHRRLSVNECRDC